MVTGTGMKRVLDLTKRSPVSEELFKTFSKRIIGQDEAVRVLTNIVEKYQAGLCDPTKPAGNALFLGPTGTGKTFTVESMCEALVGNPRACIKIDCAEFQHSHEIAKLTGSPPGYLGHRETHPMLTQEALNQFHTEKCKLSVLLLDEIEKASDALWQLLLGILDKATLTLGDNRVVNFSQVIIVMTSNLGASEMNGLYQGGIGIKAQERKVTADKIKDVAVQTAKRKFTPEFMNRIDHMVVFNTLTEKDVDSILSMELGKVQTTIFGASHTFFYLTPEARDVIFKEGYSKEYGARNIKRAIEKRISIPLSRLLSSDQVKEGETIVISEVGAPEFEYSVEEKK
jgi:ATP-dependent Clp protease ATP-binding subunit ClpB